MRNNREFDNLSKEIEFQGLEIEFSEKKIREFGEAINRKKEEIAELSERLEGRKADLVQKQGELEQIISETKQDEEKLREKAKKLEANIEPRLLTAFKRIRKGHVTAWLSYMYSVVPAVVVSTRFRPRNSWISSCVRK